ncbi:MAG: ADP-forming succinate--CoA ligase subunit beta [Pseudomonadota bacterium]|jgi:succinyl-CoA synthetase beta subunit|nr:ADP-forming succinate--CoA ligase subunit beta [Alphaproteobacteria bacterium]
MNIHEYQAKQVLKTFGIPVPRGGVAFTPDEAVKVANALRAKNWVLKAQIHAGGRGKGGGIKVVKSISQLNAEAEQMLGMTLVTPQTGPAGKVVHRIYVEQGCEIERELYLACLVDRATSRIAFIASTEGGMDIEEVAARTPEKIFTLTVEPASGVQPHHGRRIAFALGLDLDLARQCQELVERIYHAFQETDASLIEINPLVVDRQDNLICLDAKLNFDDNALFRHPEIAGLRDAAEEDPVELEASKRDLNYVKLDGEIGCLVNGAGLAMATMDIIQFCGGSPANFLDVGGGADKEKVTEAFKIILRDPNVKAILVNIFGGILRCDVIAEGIVAAARDVRLSVPLVVRLEGTNVELGQKILDESGLTILSAHELGEAAEKIVAAVKKGAN